MEIALAIIAIATVFLIALAVEVGTRAGMAVAVVIRLTAIVAAAMLTAALLAGIAQEVETAVRAVVSP